MSFWRKMSFWKRWNCDHTFNPVEAMPTGNSEFQYCNKCGYAIRVPPKPNPCTFAHEKWVCISELERSSNITGAVFKHVRVMQCTGCGKLKNFETPSDSFGENDKGW